MDKDQERLVKAQQAAQLAQARAAKKAAHAEVLRLQVEAAKVKQEPKRKSK